MNDPLPFSPSPPRPVSFHTIRLREPWRHEQHADGARHLRSFNCPTGLAPGQRVWLVIDDTPGLVCISLNGAPVGQASRLSPLPCPVRLDIAPLLQPRNELALDQTGEKPCLGQVRLEIESQ